MRNHETDSDGKRKDELDRNRERRDGEHREGNHVVEPADPVRDRESGRGPAVRSAPAGLREDDPSFDISDERDVRAMLAAERAHFWHLSRNRIIVARLEALGLAQGASILELGSGAGCVAAHLAEVGYRVTGVEGHRELVTIARSRAPGATFHCCDLRHERPPVAPASFDAAALFDVIEHLEDPVAALELALGYVRPGGWLVGTVPGMMTLWSRIDEHAGHRIRYSRASLGATLAKVRGGVVHAVRPFNRTLAPLLFVQRAMVGRRGDADAAARNLSVPWPLVNGALFKLVMIEERAARFLDRARLEGPSIWFAVRATGS